MLRFDGKVAVVTGAGNGLGRAYAMALASVGCRVLVNDLGAAPDGYGSSRQSADAVANEIRAAGGEAVANGDTVASFSGGQRIVAAALDHFGRIDAVICNAGILRTTSFTRMTEEHFDAIMAVHVRGAVAVAQPAFRWMKENGGGSLVFTTSSMGLFGGLGGPAYATAKAAMLGLVLALHAEGIRYGIRANGVSPTAGTRLSEAGGSLAKIADDMKPEDAQLSAARVAPLIVALSHPECRVSGEFFNAAGGWISRSLIAINDGVTLTEYNADQVMQLWPQIRNTKRLRIPKDLSDYWAMAQQGFEAI